jgi:hypothetical protein
MHFTDGVLSRTFNGPDGYTTMQLTAKDLSVSEDATSFRFEQARIPAGLADHHAKAPRGRST